MLTRRITVLAVAALALAATPAHAQEEAGIGPATWTPANANYSSTTITTPDGTQLHADVLRPKGLPADAKVPVVLSIGPYFNKSGQLGPANVTQAQPWPPYDPAGPSVGMSSRFKDLVEGGQLMERGYAFVAVDLRGFGGSTGCLDWVGPGEQEDVVASVKWAASQTWSSGKVGMYGKSYDGSTGLVGVAKRPEGLAAVVAQEPVYDMYRYMYGDGQRRTNSALTPGLYSAIAVAPGPLGDIPSDPMYNVNGNSHDVQRPGCHVASPADQQSNDDHYSSYWRARNLITAVKGSEVPLFLMQGLTENNTVADGMAEFLINHRGPFRAWFGPWEHVRGNEKAGTKFVTGRSTWFDEVMRFYDLHLKGIEPVVADPNVLVQTTDGKWRGEQEWPPADAANYVTQLRTGTYNDAGTSTATGTGNGAKSGIWTVSAPLTKAVHLAGGGRVTLDVTGPPRSNVAVDVYDIGANGTGPLVTRSGSLIRNNGTVSLELWSNDWKFAANRRIAVRITETNTDWWAAAVGTQQPVTVHSGEISLPFLSQARATSSALGAPSTQLAGYMAKTTTLPAGTTESPFSLPPATP